MQKLDLPDWHNYRFLPSVDSPQQRSEQMKTFYAFFVAFSMIGVNACGGMTQIDPPSLQLQAGPGDQPVESILSQIDEVLVIC